MFTHLFLVDGVHHFFWIGGNTLVDVAGITWSIPACLVTHKPLHHNTLQAEHSLAVRLQAALIDVY